MKVLYFNFEYAQDFSAKSSQITFCLIYAEYCWKMWVILKPLQLKLRIELFFNKMNFLSQLSFYYGDLFDLFILNLNKRQSPASVGSGRVKKNIFRVGSNYFSGRVGSVKFYNNAFHSNYFDPIRPDPKNI
jgi:hypothetical protein